jgi:hypothetical protein
MIDSVLNLLFRCSHRRITRPITPVMKTGQPRGAAGATYVVCLDCGKHFAYDAKEMRIGKPIDPVAETGALPPNMPKPRKSKFRYALMAAVPAAVVLGTLLKRGKKNSAPPPDQHPAPANREEQLGREV